MVSFAALHWLHLTIRGFAQAIVGKQVAMQLVCAEGGTGREMSAMFMLYPIERSSFLALQVKA